MKKVLAVMLVLCAAVAFAGAPGYYFGELMYHFTGADSTLVSYTLADGTVEGMQSSPHGVVVDPEGKLWVGFYYGYSNQVVRTSGDTIRLRGLHCFMPDGTPASFSPIEYLEFPDGSKDTIYAESVANGSCRGLVEDADHNIMMTAWSTIYKIDYTDGSGIAMWYPSMDGLTNTSCTNAAHDPEAELYYVAAVGSGNPCYILDEDLGYVGVAIDTVPTLQRGLAARTNADGVAQLFDGTIWSGVGIKVWESDDPELTAFECVDTIGNVVVETDSNTITYKAWASCLNWADRDEGILLYGNYFSAKVSTDVGAAPANPYASKWILMDVDDESVIAEFGGYWEYDQTINANIPADSLENQPMSMSPRGASIKNLGDGKYEFVVADFDISSIQKVVWSEDGVENDVPVPFGFSLNQNYPNPFNPTTNIAFNISASGNISVDVFDLSGKKVATVYNGYMEAGTHNMMFNASNLASGTYVYKMTNGNYEVSKKMTLLK